MSLRTFLALYLALPTLTTATATLFATNYDGNVYSLSLDTQGGKHTLKQTHQLKTCGLAPSWLTVDTEHDLLWCLDESSPGSLTALTVGKDGELQESAKVATLNGGVSSVIYGDKGNQFQAIAHYSGAAISSFKIPFGNKEEVKPIYIQEFNLAVKGPKPGQEQSRPHQVFVGPKNSFLLSPDLGMDLVHVFRIDKQSGKLNDCMSPIEFDKGSGPRHGVFVTSGGNHTRQLTVRHKGLPQKPHAEHTRLYVVEELGYKLCPFDVSYAGDGCPKFKKLDCFTPYPGSALPVNATLSEIQAAGQNLYVSIRSDKKFEGKDSLATLTLAKNGSVVLDGLHSSGGSVPRTFVLNQKGDLVAVGNQVSSNVVIVERNPETGKLGKEVASLQVGKVGTPGKGDGLSSLVWYEKGC